MDAALDAATSALYAQSKALSVISNNLANSSTTGYKAVSASFASLVTGASTSSASSVTGGVLASAQQNINTQGTITSTDVSTNMAINGKGMFVVGDSATGTTGYSYTRDGDFTPDSEGYLTENGYYLMGWPTDKSGNITASDTTTTSGLEAINVDRYSSSAAATQNVTVGANLPADASAGASFSSTMAIYDSLGVEEDVPVTWTKLASNEWTMSFGSPTNASTGSVSGTLGGVTTYTVDFSANGTLSSIENSSGTAVSSATLTVASWSDGADTASDGSIAIDLGTSGKADGLTQYASGETNPTVSPTIIQDGLAYGTVESVSVGTDGTVTAKYTNGESIPIYKVAVATFQNEDGLLAQSGNVFEETAESGTYTLDVAGTNGTGSIDGSSLESSNVDTSTEFTKMIQAQQAYSAASKVISTDKAMFDALISAMG